MQAQIQVDSAVLDDGSQEWDMDTGTVSAPAGANQEIWESVGECALPMAMVDLTDLSGTYQITFGWQVKVVEGGSYVNVSQYDVTVTQATVTNFINVNPLYGHNWGSRFFYTVDSGTPGGSFDWAVGSKEQ